MTIRVYFGPHKHSPAPELPLDERLLWPPDFHLLRGFDNDFWTSNPLHLDVFEAGQIMLWHNGAWVTLSEAGERIMPKWQHPQSPMRGKNSQVAVLCQMTWQLERDEAEAVGELATQP